MGLALRTLAVWLVLLLIAAARLAPAGAASTPNFTFKPAKPAGLYAKLARRKVTVNLSLRPVSEAPFQFACDVIEEESMYSWLS